MDAYVCFRYELPIGIYLVNYLGSRTAFSSTEGFSAADTMMAFGADQLTESKKAVEDQFTWGCRAGLPFISLFYDREHTEN